MGNGTHPLVSHVGFSEIRRDLAFEPVAEGDGRGANEILLKVDVLKLFSGVSSLDLAQLQSVKFDRDDARLLADNHSGMISIQGT